MDIPQAGGTYIRDPDTGALTRMTEHTREAVPDVSVFVLDETPLVFDPPADGGAAPAESGEPGAEIPAPEEAPLIEAGPGEGVVDQDIVADAVLANRTTKKKVK